MQSVYIANAGMITAIGNDLPSNLRSLLKKEHGLSYPDFLATRHHLPVGEIKYSNQDLIEVAGKSDGKGWPRTAILSLIAAKEAWDMFAHKADGLKVAFISANTVGGMDVTEQLYKEYITNKDLFEAKKFRYHECAAITELVKNALNIKGWSTTISTACSSSANSIMLGAKLIRHGMCDVVIAGGADALSKFTLNGFNSLMILDKELCKPFDANRKGLNLGEGAAYLVLCNEKAINHWHINPQVTISGYANANDAHHQTASSPDGVGNKLAMSMALEKAGIKANEIDYINLHGTGTENNDASEGVAVQSIFGDSMPYASTTKSYTGHTLGASGAVEAVFSYLSIVEEKIWSNLRQESNISNLSLKLNQEIVATKLTHVLSNSFGFGGNCSSLVLSKMNRKN